MTLFFLYADNIDRRTYSGASQDQMEREGFDPSDIKPTDESAVDDTQDHDNTENLDDSRHWSESSKRRVSKDRQVPYGSLGDRNVWDGH